MPTTIRLNDETAVVLERLARNHSQSKSEIVRRAIELLDTQEREQARPYDLVADLVGCVEGGPPDLSEHTGEKLRQLLAARKV